MQTNRAYVIWVGVNGGKWRERDEEGDVGQDDERPDETEYDMFMWELKTERLLKHEL